MTDAFFGFGSFGSTEESDMVFGEASHVVVSDNKPMNVVLYNTSSATFLCRKELAY
jgi:hypothetical protein